jgi:hypothetical protein
MFDDDLEGLGFLPGERSKYVKIILNDHIRSKESQFMIQIFRSKDLKIGDVIVEKFRTRLVRNPSVERNNFFCVIPSQVLSSFKRSYRPKSIG